MQRAAVTGGDEDTRLEAKAEVTKKSEATVKDSLFKDRTSRGQGQECSRPRTKGTGASVLKRSSRISLGDLKKQTSSKIFFRRSPKEEYEKGLRKFSTKFLAFSYKILTVQKKVLSSSRGQGNFRGIEALRPRTWPSKPRTSKCVLKAKDVLEDGTSGGCQWRFVRPSPTCT